MKKVNIDLYKFKELRNKGYRTQQIADELNVNVSTLRSRIRQENLQQSGKPHQLGKRTCDSCHHYFHKKDLKSNCKGNLCKECHEKIFGERRYGSTFISNTSR